MDRKKDIFSGHGLLASIVFSIVFILLSFLQCGLALALPSVGMDVEENGEEVVTSIRLVADTGEKIGAAGLELVYPQDRLEYVGVDPVEGATVKANVEECMVRLGYLDTPHRDSVDINVRFRYVNPQNRCVMFAIRPQSLEGAIRGARTFRVKAYCPELPEDLNAWSTTCGYGTLFLIVPRLNRLTRGSIQYQGVDVTGPVLSVGEYFYDLVRDVLFFVVPGVELPEGDYGLDFMWGYGEVERQNQVTIRVH